MSSATIFFINFGATLVTIVLMMFNVISVKTAQIGTICIFLAALLMIMYSIATLPTGVPQCL